MIKLVVVGLICLIAGFIIGCVYSSGQPYDSKSYESNDFDE
jgi:hypothetical protein